MLDKLLLADLSENKFPDCIFWSCRTGRKIGEPGSGNGWGEGEERPVLAGEPRAEDGAGDVIAATGAEDWGEKHRPSTE